MYTCLKKCLTHMLDQKKKVALKMAMVSRRQHSSLTPFLAKHITEHYKIIELFTQFQNERKACYKEVRIFVMLKSGFFSRYVSHIKCTFKIRKILP